MITAEDVDGNLLATLSSLVSFQGKRVLDLGTGTGRIPLLLNGKTAPGDRAGQLPGDAPPKPNPTRTGRWELGAYPWRHAPIANHFRLG